MIRKAFKMHVYPDQVNDYISRHNPIWAELQIVLKEHGVHNYNIFLDRDTNVLFAYVEVESESKWNAIAHNEICKAWWAYMADVMDTNKDNSPIIQELEHVFYLK